MEQLTFFNKALRQLDDHLFELPHFCRLLMHSLFKHCDFKTGRISNITMEQMQRDLYVAPASGRKRQKITADTIRGAFRTMQKFKPDDFIFSVEKQRIVIELPFIRELFANFDAPKKDATVEAGEGEAQVMQASLCDISETIGSSAAEKSSEVTLTEEPKTPVKNINNINNNNNNKAWLNKQPITRSFTPSRETIETAQALGFHDANKPEVIADFIAKNKAWGSAFADYQPVYLNFLVRRAERLQLNNKTQPTSSGRDFHADRRQPKTRSLTPSERVIRAYASEFDYCERTGQFFDKGSLTQSVNGFVMEAAL